MNRHEVNAAAAAHEILFAKFGRLELPPQSVDHVITDPPYLPDTQDNVRSGSGKGRAVRGGRIVDRFAEEVDLDFEPLTPELRLRWAGEIARVVRRWTHVFSDQEGADGWRRDLERSGLIYVRTAIWVRIGSAPQFTGDRPAQGHECIVIAHAPGERMRWNAGGKRGVYTHAVAKKSEGRFHEAQKPLGLIRELVRDFTDVGEIVFDPFAGSGTHVLAAKVEGRLGFGLEKDGQMAARARERVDAAVAGSALSATTR